LSAAVLQKTTLSENKLIQKINGSLLLDVGKCQTSHEASLDASLLFDNLASLKKEKRGRRSSGGPAEMQGKETSAVLRFRSHFCDASDGNRVM
jgi:hypothetical protein